MPHPFHIFSRWTADEHRLFLEGIMLYGKDWKKMQAIIKTRTLVQIRTHAQKVEGSRDATEYCYTTSVRWNRFLKAIPL